MLAELGDPGKKVFGDYRYVICADFASLSFTFSSISHNQPRAAAEAVYGKLSRVLGANMKDFLSAAAFGVFAERVAAMRTSAAASLVKRTLADDHQGCIDTFAALCSEAFPGQGSATNGVAHGAII